MDRVSVAVRSSDVIVPVEGKRESMERGRETERGSSERGSGERKRVSRKRVSRERVSKESERGERVSKESERGERVSKESERGERESGERESRESEADGERILSLVAEDFFVLRKESGEERTRTEDTRTRRPFVERRRRDSSPLWGASAEAKCDYFAIFRMKLMEFFISKKPSFSPVPPSPVPSLSSSSSAFSSYFPSSPSSLPFPPLPPSAAPPPSHLPPIYSLLHTLSDGALSLFSLSLSSLALSLQSRVRARDLASYPASHKEGKVCDSLRSLARFLNDLCRWVEVVTLGSWDATERGNVLSFFIHLAERAREANSFYIAFGIVTALLSPHLQRSISSYISFSDL